MIKQNALTLEQLRKLQLLPLDEKIKMTEASIHSAYEWSEGKIYVSVSGKDSLTLLHIVRRLYPDTPGVFVNTGLEFPEIKSHIKTLDNVEWLRPKKPFHQVLKDNGYPVTTKINARFLRDLQNPTDRNEQTRRLHLEGIRGDGSISKYGKLSQRYLYLINSPFKISEQCCIFTKETPMVLYTKSSERMPLMGIMAYESRDSERKYLKYGCNAFQLKKPHSHPISFWLEDDIWSYIRKNNMPYPKIYDMGERRTGCMFCGFGVHLEKPPNRYQRLQKTHPRYWEYCIEELGWKQIWDFMGVQYWNTRRGFGLV